MPIDRYVLVAGGPVTLAMHLAAACLDRGDTVAVAPAEPGLWPPDGVARLCDDPAGASRRLHTAALDASPDAVPEADEVWCLAPGCDPAARRGLRIDTSVVHQVVSALGSLHPRRLCYVGPGWMADAAGTHTDDLADRYSELATFAVERAAAAGIAAAALSVDPVVSAGSTSARDGGLAAFAHALLSVRDELAERHPRYLAAQPLRFLADHDGGLPLLDAATAAQALLHAAACSAAGAEQERAGDVRATVRLDVQAIAEELGSPLAITLRATWDERELNAVDRLFVARLDGVGAGLRRACALPAAGLGARAAVRGALQAAVTARAARPLPWRPGSPPPSLVETVAMDTTLGARSYQRAGGTGTPLVLLNAFGLGPQFWYRLIQQQALRRVLLWTGQSEPVPLLAQLDDLTALLAREGIDRGHFVCWCSTAALTLEYARKHPDTVASVTLLNGFLTRPGDGDAQFTASERMVMQMMHETERQPGLAEKLAANFAKEPRKPLPDVHDTTPEGSQRVAREVLNLSDRSLQSAVRASMLDPREVRLALYRVRDTASLDPLREPGQLALPVLSVGCEYDRTSSPERLRRNTRLLPDGRYVQIQGATHLALHERAELVSQLIEDFVTDPARRGERSGELAWDAPAAAHR
jgi:pimeloyl-ACP methyl ester carboxylesterase